MISIRKTITELEESQQQRDLAFDCYLAALRNIAHYTIEFDNSITEPYRRYVTSLAEEVSMAAPESLTESRGTLRGLLRDYRDKASHYLRNCGTTRQLRRAPWRRPSRAWHRPMAITNSACAPPSPACGEPRSRPKALLCELAGHCHGHYSTEHRTGPA